MAIFKAFKEKTLFPLLNDSKTQASSKDSVMTTFRLMR